MLEPMSGDASDYSVTYSSHVGEEQTSAQLFHRGEQFAEVLDSPEGLKVQFFGPSEGYPPELDLDMAQQLLTGAARRLREILGDEPDAA